MISFTILTSDRQALASALQARGVLNSDNTPVSGVEIAEVPNPIVTDQGSGGDPLDPDYVPPTYDSRWCYLVKLAHEAEASDDDGTVVPDEGDETPLFTRSKIVAFVKRNGTATTLDDSTRAWSFAGGKHYLLDPRDQAKFGVWQ